MTDDDKLLTVTVTLTPEKKLNVHVHNEEIDTDLLLDALMTAIKSCEKRIDMIAQQGGGLVPELLPGSTH